ncbi:MAG: diaminopimelate decarboxylase [Candidatus Marinimicrobia bacterium]|nr:diaminopimelate decarboxylase [Candidatus Neomarinimicrobiota bacterium]
MEKVFEFLTPERAFKLAKTVGTPTYIYDEGELCHAAKDVLNFPHAFGFKARYAIKANPNAYILRLFDKLGLHFDASSGYEAERAMLVGINPEKIQITAQEYPKNLKYLLEKGVLFNATSCLQLEMFGNEFPGKEVSIRVNPGIGSGHNNRTNVGGLSSSFGIWHEWIPEVKKIAEKYGLTVTKLHTHIGSGSDPKTWEKVVNLSLNAVKKFPHVHTLNLGGGYKIARTATEKSTDLLVIGLTVKKAFETFYKETGRKLDLEIEPGTYLVAKAGILLSKIIDKVSTGKDGYTFLKLDTGMNDMTRTTLYGAIHPVKIYPANGILPKEKETVVVVGHCCESGDIFTPVPGDPEGILPIELPKSRVGDLLAFGVAGAYCASMSLINYNSFPQIPEVLIALDGKFILLRKRQSLQDMIALECEEVLDLT